MFLGLRNDDDISEELFFPFTAYILKKRGYFAAQGKKSVKYASEGDSELKEDLFNNNK